MEGAKEYRTSWGKFLRHMKERGINGVRLFISDKSMGAGRYPVGFLPWGRMAAMYRPLLYGRDELGAAEQTGWSDTSGKDDPSSGEQVVFPWKSKTGGIKTQGNEIAKRSKSCSVEEGAIETLGYYDFLAVHWQHLRTNNPLERINRKILRRARVVGCFHDEQSAIMLI